MKVGLLGGSFDPIHCGHLWPVREARQAVGLDRVIYLPTGRPPHKPGRKMASAHARFAMVELALLPEEGLYASPHELTEKEQSYTVDTLETFHRRQPADDLYLLLGADSYQSLTAWRSWRRILELARLVVLTHRPGWDAVREHPDSEIEAARQAGRVHLVENQPVDISASEIRRSLRLGRRPRLVPEPVLDYIYKYELYAEHQHDS